VGKQYVKVNGAWVQVYPVDTWHDWVWYGIAIVLVAIIGIWMC